MVLSFFLLKYQSCSGPGTAITATLTLCSEGAFPSYLALASREGPHVNPPPAATISHSLSKTSVETVHVRFQAGGARPRPLS